jgi:hypothetical protein
VDGNALPDFYFCGDPAGGKAACLNAFRFLTKTAYDVAKFIRTAVHGDDILVLDYPRSLLAVKNGRHAVTIPPFHAGHLGFVPDSEVHIGLLAPFTEDGTHCEVLVTPYESGKYLGRLTCTMLDQRGVVKKLVDAISDLKVNILLVETSSIHHARYHQINLLFDWGTSEFDPAESSSSSDQLRYQVYRTSFPIDRRCYVLMFEKIVRYCLEDLALDQTAGLPALKIRPVTTPRNLDARNRLRIERLVDIVDAREPNAKKKYPGHVAVVLSEEMEHVLRQRLVVPKDKPLEYLLISETEDRILRAFFPTPQNLQLIVHVGIRHEDRPGAMAQLLTLVRAAGFNVITSLLRQSDGVSRMWEGLLQYEGVRQLVDRKDPEIYRWVADRLACAALGAIDELKGKLDSNDLRIGPPRYPKANGKQILLSEALAKLKEKQCDDPESKKETEYVAEQMKQYREEFSLKLRDPEPKDGWDLVDDRKNHLFTIDRPDADRPQLSKIYDLVMAAQFARIKPRIFLSYPGLAKEKADLVEKKLSEHFEFVRYQEGDLKIIVQEVIRRIESCDYFIGIWDPDRPSGRFSGNSRNHQNSIKKPRTGSKLSAWLPFEYGIAKTAKKPAIIAHHNQLDKKVWNRISPEVALPGYDDNAGSTFKKIALPVIYRHCLQEWMPSHSRQNRPIR